VSNWKYEQDGGQFGWWQDTRGEVEGEEMEEEGTEKGKGEEGHGNKGEEGV
jgi:hypothetical protein